MTYENEWLYNDQVFDESMIGDHIGFVYLITNKTSGKLYIGKKLFWFSKTKSVKGKKKRIKELSDWKEYYGSNKELLTDVETYGKVNFERRILYLCKTKGQCSYYEAREQFVRDVLLNDNYYNSWITVKVSSVHVKPKAGAVV